MTGKYRISIIRVSILMTLISSAASEPPIDTKGNGLVTVSLPTKSLSSDGSFLSTENRTTEYDDDDDDDEENEYGKTEDVVSTLSQDPSISSNLVNRGTEDVVSTSTLDPSFPSDLWNSGTDPLEQQQIRSNHKEEVCPKIGMKQVARAVVKCHCKGNEILVKGECQTYKGETMINVEKDYYRTEEVRMSDYTVIIRDIKCNTTLHEYHNFTKSEFRLRAQGDMILLESTGRLHLQRLNNYCLSHHLDSNGDLTWTMKACLPIPSVPRCCRPGQAIKDGYCQPAKTPTLLTPPIGTNFRNKEVEWPHITNYFSPVNCADDSFYTVRLDLKNSLLLSYSDGLTNSWKETGTYRFKNQYCPEFCVDGIEKPDGSTEYYTSFCFNNTIETYQKVCGDNPCIRKCCNYGYSMDLNRFDCVKDLNSTFNPPTVNDISKYRVTLGRALCQGAKMTNSNITIEGDGELSYGNTTILPTDFCVDTFVNNEVRDYRAIACLRKVSLWLTVRKVLFPICYVISLFFLSLTIACHLLVPKLMAKGGIHQLCHIIALVIAYASTFSINIFHEYFTNEGCICNAIFMQFGYLTTFFWLNVMCFEVWRKIRSLKIYRPSKTYPTVYYMLYAWGIPFLICIITIGMQYLAPPDVKGVIKPYIGVSRCWFKEDIALLLYYFGPIGILFTCNTLFLFLTHLDYRKITRDYKDTKNTLNDVGDQASSYPLSKKQLTDHVQDFQHKLMLFGLMATCWVTEVLSWLIPPMEVWAPTDTLNALQGVVIFIIFLSNYNKRKEMQQRNALPFLLIQCCLKIPHWMMKLLGCKEDRSPENSTSLPMTTTGSSLTLMSILSTSGTSLSHTPSRSISAEDKE